MHICEGCNFQCLCEIEYLNHKRSCEPYKKTKEYLDTKFSNQDPKLVFRRPRKGKPVKHGYLRPGIPDLKFNDENIATLSKEDSPVVFDCKLCGFTCHKKIELYKHVINHGNNSEPSTNNNCLLVETLLSTDTKPCQCSNETIVRQPKFLEKNEIKKAYDERQKSKLTTTETISSYGSFQCRKINPDVSLELNLRQTASQSTIVAVDDKFDTRESSVPKSSDIGMLQTFLPHNENLPTIESTDPSLIENNLNREKLSVPSYFSTPRKRSSMMMNETVPNKKKSPSPKINIQAQPAERSKSEVEFVFPKGSEYNPIIVNDENYETIASPHQEREEKSKVTNTPSKHSISQSSTLTGTHSHNEERLPTANKPNNKPTQSPKSLSFLKYSSKNSSETNISVLCTPPDRVTDESKSPSPSQRMRSFTQPDEFKSPNSLQKSQPHKLFHSPTQINKITDEFKSQQLQQNSPEFSAVVGTEEFKSPSPSQKKPQHKRYSSEPQIVEGTDKFESPTQLQKVRQHKRSFSQPPKLKPGDSSLYSYVYGQPCDQEPRRVPSQSGTQSSTAVSSQERTSGRECTAARMYYHCRACGIAFEDQRMFAIHMMFHSHSNPFQCRICKNIYPNREDFFVHFTSVLHRYPSSLPFLRYRNNS